MNCTLCEKPIGSPYYFDEKVCKRCWDHAQYLVVVAKVKELKEQERIKKEKKKP